MKNIQHIIFDFGGVILNIDYKKTEEAFINLGIKNFGELYSKMRQSELFDQLETGKISKHFFIKTIRDISGQAVDDGQIIAAWNAMLLDLPLERLQLLQQLRGHHDLFLLSNTNEIHEQAFNQKLKSLTGFDSMAVFFDKVYYSHRIGIRKPDREIFELILATHDLDPLYTLFIDDSPQHIKAAESLGVQTIYLKKGMTIEEIFSHRL